MRVFAFTPGDGLYGFDTVVESSDEKRMVLKDNHGDRTITIEVAEEHNSLDNDQHPPRVKMTISSRDIDNQEITYSCFGYMLDLSPYGRSEQIVIFQEPEGRTFNEAPSPNHPLGPPLTRPINLTKPSGA
ncbi:MAG: hypothetical protein HYW88_03075 [Candidatus Sungbacteria bacterium]|nr:hypothetical protein [Candidatus Sungbacteria bacterium]